jgi:site-specific DNA-methyltransferase (adenine-specific)
MNWSVWGLLGGKNMAIEYFNEDCMIGMARYPDKYFELAIVDPPYGIGDTFVGTSTGTVRGKLSRIHRKIDWDHNVPDDAYFSELARVSSKQIIWGANYFNSFSKDGGGVVWYKNRGGGYLSECELASVSGQKRVDYVAIQILTGFVSQDHRIHPTQKPVALYKWLLTNYAKPGDKILDTHVGSASSLIACYDMGFDAVGFELDSDYYKASMQRLQDFMRQPKIMEYVDQYEQMIIDEDNS